MKIFEVPEILEQRRRAGGPWMEFCRVPAMSLGVYVLRPGEEDTQTPHAEDEIYYVLGGRGSIRIGDTDRPVRTGSLIFVEARAPHRFHSITEELTLLVLFAPAEDMEAAKTDDFGLARIGQIAVPVGDIERAIAFYRDTLGMRFLFKAPPGLGFFDCDGVRLMLDAPAGARAGKPGSTLYYKVGDLQAAFETLSGRGVAFEAKPHLIAQMPDHELWMAFFRDPDGNLLALMSEVRK